MEGASSHKDQSSKPSASCFFAAQHLNLALRLYFVHFVLASSQIPGSIYATASKKRSGMIFLTLCLWQEAAAVL